MGPLAMGASKRTQLKAKNLIAQDCSSHKEDDKKRARADQGRVSATVCQWRVWHCVLTWTGPFGLV